MLFFINPGRGRGITTRTRRRRRRRARAKGEAMATRRKRNRKGQFVKARSNPTRRRRRRASVRRNPGRFALAANPTRRRRRRRHAVMANPRRVTHRRRRRSSGVFRRNPSGIVGALMQGLKDGAGVVGGQVAVRKLRGAVSGMLPADVQAKATTGAGGIALSVVSALAVSMAARKFAPSYARVIAAGAFSETINSVLATTPIAPYLSAWPSPGGRPAQLSAYPGAGVKRLPAARGVAAYPHARVVGIPMAHAAGM